MQYDEGKRLPGMFWGEAMNCVVYVLNRSLCKGSDGRTPYELWIGTTPAVSYFRTFGCITHMKVSTRNLKKLSDRSKRMIFIGYELGSAAYKCYDPISRWVMSADMSYLMKMECWIGQVIRLMICNFISHSLIRLNLSRQQA
jgi:hypothetical protein